MASHIFLVGYRGSGKSSVGRQLGAILGMPVVDSDDLIEQEAGKSIREIFLEQGEGTFRDIESEVIRRLVERPEATVVALGGGAVLREANRALLAKHGLSVWLQASVDQIDQRMAEDSTTAKRRPALTRLNQRDEIIRLLEVREPIYRAVADWIVPTDCRPIDEIASQVANWYLDRQRTDKSEPE